MDRTEKLRRSMERAEAKRAAVVAACPVPIVMRESHGVLDPNQDGPRDDSSDRDASIAIGLAPSLDLEAFEQTSFSGEVSWHEVACAVLENFPPPLDDSARVWISKMGSLYHRYDDCEVMWNGKRLARDEGMKVHAVRSMLLPEAREGRGGFGHKLSACKVCL